MDCIYRFKHLLKEEATDLFVEALSLYHKVTEIYASHELADLANHILAFNSGILDGFIRSDHIFMMNFICVIEFFSLCINESFSEIWLKIHNLDSDMLAISEGFIN